ncbi:ribonuclease III [Nitratireductor aquibiodomus]|uniref:ribonuclease III n=1 Tax=Nitratireductor aquibiodomus TaxID=204799 RepID=UPI0019D35D8E|nr:ribonuclease III [Nitratireductor aquibiodomus]MBN7763929.1 ribonuclease III [Nitratireductor aquibiodomus]
MAVKRLRGPQLVAEVSRRTGFAYKDAALVEEAMTHSSARGRAGVDYQRLEFLGDRVLGLAVAELLFESFPKAPEGELSVRLNALVNAETLAEVADELDISPLIHMGSDLRGAATRKQINLRADVMEALIAVVFLEAGIDPARTFVRTHWGSRARAKGADRRDPKTALQEWAHQVAGVTPAYSVDDRQGPDHDPVFSVAVKIKGYDPAFGKGRSKREAEQAAATTMLEREGVWHRNENVS